MALEAKSVAFQNIFSIQSIFSSSKRVFQYFKIILNFGFLFLGKARGRDIKTQKSHRALSTNVETKLYNKTSVI